MFTAEAVAHQHARLVELLAAHGVTLAAIEVCPHAPADRCTCRKPAPGMIVRSAARLGIDLGTSFMVGDKSGDIEAGRAAGCRTVLVGADPATTEREADHVCRDIGCAARWICRQAAGDGGGEESGQ
jgi:D-glycero-D-manno-heptose 1,7-bisphosphate phosphatase